MENFPSKINTTEKKYLYHRVPDNMEGSELFPLKDLEKISPDIFLSHMEKYTGREWAPNQFIEYLNTHWNEVLMFSPVSPEELKKGIESALEKIKSTGVETNYIPKEMKFYQIDPDLYPDILDPNKTAIALFEYDEKGNELDTIYHPFSTEKLAKHTQLPEQVIQAYVKKIQEDGRPLLFLGVPHIMHKGSIDISNCPIIVV